jgi:hypothetical protein
LKLTRKEKIKLLEKVKEGKLSLQSLESPQTYFFLEVADLPGTYEMKGKLYNENEYRQFCKQVKDKNDNSIIWNEGKTYEDTIITLVCSRGCEPLNDE